MVDHELVARAVLSVYLDQLPARGAKPGTKSNGRIEWTVLAAFVLSYSSPCSTATVQAQQTPPPGRVYTVISLATGLRCLPYASLPLNGDVLHDQHAEVLARRGARHWLLTRVHHEARLDPSHHTRIFEPIPVHGARASPRWSLRQGVKLHLYVSTLPCGDASNKLLEFQRAAQDQRAAKRDALTPDQLLALHTTPTTPDTGYASRHQGEVADQAATDVVRGRASSSHHQQHATHGMGSLRTKPGRPDSPPSICMSCSDKLSLWNAPGVGMQGSLLSALLAPVYIDSITISDHPTRHIFPAFPLAAADAGQCCTQRQELKRILAHDCKRALQRARNQAAALHGATESETELETEIDVGWSRLPFPDSREAKLEQAWSGLQAQQGDVGVDKAFQTDYEPVSCPNSVLYIAPAWCGADAGMAKIENLAAGTKMGASTKRARSKGTAVAQERAGVVGEREPLKPPARSMVCRLNYFQMFTAILHSLTNTNTNINTKAGSESGRMRYIDAKEGAFAEATKEYRSNKSRWLGSKRDADATVESFLANAREATAIKAATAPQARGERLEQRVHGGQAALFKGWLRTPTRFSQFDLDGRTSCAPTALSGSTRINE